MDLRLTDEQDPRRPGAGPHNTLARTRSLPAGARRRTMSTDVTRPEGPHGRVVIEVAGRDVEGNADGAATVLDEIGGRIAVDHQACIASADIDGGHTPTPGLAGLSLASGWGRAVSGVTPPARTLLVSLLEDLGGAFLVSGYAPLRSGVLRYTPDQMRGMAEGQADVCLGWARGGDLFDALVTTGANPVPYGPAVSPELVEGWHPMPEPAPHTVRRIRRIDVDPADGGRSVQSHFRDSYVPADADEAEMVMHEYLVHARFDGDELAEVEVEPRVLPWQSCPGAIHGAQELVGVSAAELAERARRDLRGPTTCTHLTSTMRSMADVSYLTALESRGNR